MERRGPYLSSCTKIIRIGPFTANIFGRRGTKNTFVSQVLRDAPLDFKGGSRKFGSGQVFFFSSLARKVFLFPVPNGASFSFFSSRWGKFFFLKFVFKFFFLKVCF